MNIDQRPLAPSPYDGLNVPTFTLSSTVLTDGAPMPTSATADAGSLSPDLAWHGFPQETASFMLTCFDPDAPVPSGFWHWTVSNIPANVTSIDTGADAPAGALTHRNDAGVAGFLGAAPPAGHGPHRYIFCVTAVDVEKLDIDENASPAVVNFNLLGHGLGRAFLTVTYAEPAA